MAFNHHNNDPFVFVDHELCSDDEGDFMMGHDLGFQLDLSPQHPNPHHQSVTTFNFSGSPRAVPPFPGEEFPHADTDLREPSPLHLRTTPHASPRNHRQQPHNSFPFDDFLSSNEFPSFGVLPESQACDYGGAFGFTDKPEPTPSYVASQNHCPNNNAIRAATRNQPCFFSPPPMSATEEQSTSPPMNRISLADHWTDTSPIRTERGDRMDDMCDADKYLHNGLEDIDHALQFHFAGRQFPRHVSKRAKELFKNSYELQLSQKDGGAAFRPNRGDGAAHQAQIRKRKRFARRKAFVVTAIVVAMKEFGLSLNARTRKSDADVVEALSETVPGGSKIRLTSVKSCCRSLSLTDIRFR